MLGAKYWSLTTLQICKSQSALGSFAMKKKKMQLTLVHAQLIGRAQMKCPIYGCLHIISACLQMRNAKNLIIYVSCSCVRSSLSDQSYFLTRNFSATSCSTLHNGSGFTSGYGILIWSNSHSRKPEVFGGASFESPPVV